MIIAAHRQPLRTTNDFQQAKKRRIWAAILFPNEASPFRLAINVFLELSNNQETDRVDSNMKAQVPSPSLTVGLTKEVCFVTRPNSCRTHVS